MNFITIWETQSSQKFTISEFSPNLVLHKTDKNTDWHCKMYNYPNFNAEKLFRRFLVVLDMGDPLIG